VKQRRARAKPNRAPQATPRTRGWRGSLTDVWRRVADERLRMARKLYREHRRLGSSGNARTREPVFSCRECVFRMDSVHWRIISDEETAVLRALKSGGPATIGDILRRTPRRKAGPLLQALATLTAQGYIEFRSRASETRRGRRHSRVLPSWAKLLLPEGSRLGLGPASEAGRALARLHPKSRRPPA